MPEPAVLRRHRVCGETVVSHGRRVVFRYDDDIAMRNLAVVALTDAGTPGVEVAATFGLSAEYVSRLRARAGPPRRGGRAGGSSRSSAEVVGAAGGQGPGLGG